MVVMVMVVVVVMVSAVALKWNRRKVIKISPGLENEGQ